MTVSQIECPHCGGFTTFDNEHDICYCMYCGKQIALGERKTIVYKDIAKIRELELEEKRREENKKQKQLEEKARKKDLKRRVGCAKMLLWPLLLGVIGIVFYFVNKHFEFVDGMLDFLILLGSIGLIVITFLLFNEIFEDDD